MVRLDQLFAVGGPSNKVQVRRTSDGSLVVEFAPYAASYTGGVTVAMGDVNGDGYADLIVGSAVGAAHVKVYDGKALANGTFSAANAESHLLTQFMAYEPRFGVGVNVAVASVHGGASADIITGATCGNPHVKVYNSQAIANGSFDPAHPDASLLAEWFAYDLNLNAGATVAGGDLEGNGFADVVTGATAGNPHVKVYSGRAIATGAFSHTNPDASLLAQVFPFPLQANLGVSVAVGDISGDGHLDLITGALAGNPQVKVYAGEAIANGTFNPSTAEANKLDDFFAFDLGSNIGAMVGTIDFGGSNGAYDILARATHGSPAFRVIRHSAKGSHPSVVFED
jgi:serralysin